MIPAPQTGDANLSVVSDLIDNESRTWKSDVVRNNFTAPDTDAIFNIPLRRGGGEDFWAWNWEKSGTYIVKSSYRALMTCNEQ